ncbi:xanthine dehydrogenase family protein molybdopterin-binding subunit [soil metagenome]
MQAEPTTKPTSKPAPRDQEFPVGIAGVSISQAQRTVGPGEPPALPINEKLSVIGKSTPRLDGRLKVTGAAKYTADVKLPGMLYARMIVSPHPHATIKSIDLSAAEKARGVNAIHILDRDFGAAQTKEDKESKYPRIRYAGQPIGGVAALTQADADDAARLVKIQYDVQPFVVDLEKAKQPNAPLVFKGKAEQAGSAGGGGGPKGLEQNGNVRGPARQPRGDIEKGFADAEITVEGDYRTQVQTHSALETHGLIADWKPDQLTVYASTQGTSSVRDELAAVFDLKKANVRVITEFMGGGFGAKFGAGSYGVLATNLSKKAGAPVKLMLDRRQEHLCVGNRPSSSQKVKIGAKKDGTLTAIQVLNFGTAGTGTGAGATGPAQNLYKCENVLTEDSDVFTHAGPSAAFRAPGHPQGVFALEQAIDELAEKLEIDPLALRDKIDASEARAQERKIGADKIGWSSRRKPASDAGPIKKGMGVAQAIWYRFMSPDSHAECRVTRDGSVELLSGVQDIGTGIRTALAMVVAEELGLKPTDITIKIGDTAYPAGPGSGGSVTTNSITPVARNAAYEIKKQLTEQFAALLGVEQSDVVFADAKVSSKSNPSNALTFKAACKKLKTEQLSAVAHRSADYPMPDEGGGRRAGGRRGGASGGLGGVQFAEVSVDTRTGVIKVDRVVAVHDCGRPINPLGLESQINGGVIQGISYALYENRILDRNTGIMVNGNLEQYKIAGSREMPIIEPILIEQYWGRSSTDAAGIGEPATVPTAGAIANAVYNAIGVRIRQMPMTPAVVLAALASKNGGATPNKTASGD